MSKSSWDMMILKSLIFEHWKRFYSETAEVIVGKNWSSRCPGHTLSSKKNWRKNFFLKFSKNFKATVLKFFFEPEIFFFSESNEILLVPRVHINKCSRRFVCAWVQPFRSNFVLNVQKRDFFKLTYLSNYLTLRDLPFWKPLYEF